MSGNFAVVSESQRICLCQGNVSEKSCLEKLLLRTKHVFTSVNW